MATQGGSLHAEGQSVQRAWGDSAPRESAEVLEAMWQAWRRESRGRRIQTVRVSGSFGPESHTETSDFYSQERGCLGF